MYTPAEKLYTADQVRRLDSCAINQHGIPGFELMKRAGSVVFETAVSRYPDARRWVVICGSGNNAGDGYVVARLAKQAGKDVALYALRPYETLNGDALTAAQEYVQSGGEVKAWPPSDESRPDLVIDALLGTGLDRTVEGDYAEAISWMNAQKCPGIAVDIPSGLNADTGQVMGQAFNALCTITFIGLKQGLFTSDGPDYAGEVVFNKLDIPDKVYLSEANSGLIIREKFLASSLVPRKRNSHKGTFGHVLVVGGAAGMAGAVRLAGEAALRTGAGLVSIATVPSHASYLNMDRPELMVSGVANEAELGGLIDKASVLAVGPGLGTDSWAVGMFNACISNDSPLVVDADGLNILANNPSTRDDWILTPHPAEAGRLLQTDTETIQNNRVEAAKGIAQKYQAVVALKGCGTVLAAQDGSYAICPLGNPGMATAGSGDVLTGVIASFLGQGLNTWDAAAAGVVAHAMAGDHAAAMLGERGMVAGDMVESLPGIVRPQGGSL
jgi:NAD(P)H-hydrate epimerase